MRRPLRTPRRRLQRQESDDDPDPAHENVWTLSALSTVPDLDATPTLLQSHDSQFSQVLRRGSCYSRAFQSDARLPYHYPPTIRLVKRIQEFDPDLMPERLISASVSSYGAQVCRRVRRIAERTILDIQEQKINLSPVSDGFAARSFKRFLTDQGRELSVLAGVPDR
jgi:hypothetical protein